MTKKSTDKMARTRAGAAYDRDIDPHTLVRLMNSEPAMMPEPTQRRTRPRAPGPHRVAYLAANPDGTRPLKLGDECAGIERALRLALHGGDFALAPRFAVTIEDLLRHLDELDPSVVSLAGHGSPGGWLLQDAVGRPEVVSPRALARIVGVAAPNARVVVLNGCWTTDHASALSGVVDVAVAMRGAVRDDAARMFAAGFYTGLGNRRSIGAAVDHGIALIAARELPDEALPHCVTRPCVDAYEVFLPCPQPGDAR